MKDEDDEMTTTTTTTTSKPGSLLLLLSSSSTVSSLMDHANFPILESDEDELAQAEGASPAVDGAASTGCAKARIVANSAESGFRIGDSSSRRQFRVLGGPKPHHKRHDNFG